MSVTPLARILTTVPEGEENQLHGIAASGDGNGIPYESLHAEGYDAFYVEKDYIHECNLIEQAFRRYSSGPVETVLDLGCGTGNHSLELASRGYRVVGVDRSKPMLEQARAKSRNLAGESVQFVMGDIKDINLHETFDAAIMMFAVLGYQTANAEALAAMKTTRRHLKPGASFIFDCWFGPAVISDPPSKRSKTIQMGRRQLVREATGKVDILACTCHVDYRLQEFEDDRLVSEAHENHVVRFFFKPELDLLLAESGLRLERLGQFPNFDHDPDETCWRVLGVATALDTQP